MTAVRVVTQYVRPQSVRMADAEAAVRRDFDWPAAVGRLGRSARRAMACGTLVLTDPATPLAGPALRVPVRDGFLMLWLLDSVLAYLESPAFDRDTVLVSPDSLVLGDLRPWLGGYDVGLLTRDRPKPILNSVMGFPLAGRAGAVRLFRRACDHASGLDEAALLWGADIDAVVAVTGVRPGEAGTRDVGGSRVRFLPAAGVLRSIRPADLAGPRPAEPVADFKGRRKRWMAGACRRWVD